MGGKQAKKTNKKLQMMSILAVGNSNAGKTALIRGYENLMNNGNCFISQDIQTIQSEFYLVEYIIKEEKNKKTKIKVKMWDSSGNERFHTIVISAMKNTQGIVLVYDITLRQTFDDLSGWIDTIKEIKDITNFPIIIIGNKSDLEDKRQVPIEEAKKFAEGFGLPYFETSVRTGEGVKEAFSALIEKVYEQNKK